MNTTIERYVIRHISGSKANQVEEFDFSKKTLTIGRTASSSIQFDPEQDVVVSREHGAINKESSEPPVFTITDNNSRNGIFVNKDRVKGSVKLNPGDTVQLGSNGPSFVFDVYPRPQDMMMATRVMEIPTSIKATTLTAVPEAEVVSSTPPKTGLGKHTVERMLVSERKKSTSKMMLVIGGIIVVLGLLGYSFRSKLFPRPPAPVVINNNTPVDTKKKSPEMIAKENEEKVVQIEFGWQLFDVNTSDELWHEYTVIKGPGGVPQYAALYIQNPNGGIEPYLDVKKNINIGVPIGIAGASGTGFVVSNDGFILTNRHVGASWNTRYSFADYAFPGVLVKFENGKRVIDPNVQIGPEQVGGWVPAGTQMVGGRPVNPGMVKGRNTYLNVIFAGTSLRRPVQLVSASDNHDVALLKVEIPESLASVALKDNYNEVKPGQSVTVMGYPGVAPEEFVIRKSNDPFNPNSTYTTIPTPTVTPGNVGRIIPASSEKNLSYSTFGDSYQLTINATGAGNSGGPMFDDEGNVIGIYYAGKMDSRGTQISFAIPIKYGLELMGRKKM